MKLRDSIKKVLKLIYPLMPTVKIRRILLIWCGYEIGFKVHLPACLKISDLNYQRNNVFLGNRVSIGPNVLIITDSSPNNSKLLKLYPMVSKKVIIKEDAWIGASVTILPGVTIGKCSIVAAGSMVKTDVPDYSIAAGLPAKIVRKIDTNGL